MVTFGNERINEPHLALDCFLLLCYLERTLFLDFYYDQCLVIFLFKYYIIQNSKQCAHIFLWIYYLIFIFNMILYFLLGLHFFAKH
jgi:hypothetical protein